MNALPGEIINLMVRLEPATYGAISRLNRWFRSCLIRDLEVFKQLLSRRVEFFGKVYFLLPNGKRHGECIDRYVGYVSSRYYYINDKRHGTFTNYYPCGQIRDEGYYINGVLEGKYTTYYASGKIHSECTYVNGKRHGAYHQYYESGKLYSECNYVNGERQGKCIKYLESGEIIDILHYIDNHLIDGEI